MDTTPMENLNKEKKTCDYYCFDDLYFINEKYKNIESKINRNVIEFIKRRFHTLKPGHDEEYDETWLEGNCYWFAKILSDRFHKLDIIYDTYNGHFMAAQIFDDIWIGYDIVGIGIPINKEDFNKYIIMKELWKQDRKYYYRLMKYCKK